MTTAASPDATSPRIGVVTVVYRSDDVLGAFLASLPAASAEPIAAVVVDNAPGDPATVELTATGSAAYLPLPSNPGYGSGMNAGVRLLPPSVEWIVIANPDVVFEPGSIDRLRTAAALDPTIGAVGPAVVNEDGTVYPSARSIPSIRTGIGHALFANVWPSNPWTRRYRQETTGDPVARDTGWLSGSCILFPRAVYEQLGGFDEGYFMYFEDVDFGYRLGRAGWRSRYEPAARVSHLGAHSTVTESDRMVRAHHESARRFLGTRYPGPARLPLRVILSAGLRLRSWWVRLRTSRRTG